MDSKTYEAGKAHGKTEEKGNQIIDKVTNAAISARDTVTETVSGKSTTTPVVKPEKTMGESAMETIQQAGQTVQASALGATDAVKNAFGLKK